MGGMCWGIASTLTTQVAPGGKRVAAPGLDGSGGAGCAATGATPAAPTIARMGSNREHQCQENLCKADLRPAYYGRRAICDCYIHATDSRRGRYARTTRRYPSLFGERRLLCTDLP